MLVCRNIPFGESSSWAGLMANSLTVTFFQTKEWLELWLKHFPNQPHILVVSDGDQTIGIAPFNISSNTISFIGLDPILGKELVSDFGDVITLPGREKDVWEGILKEYKGREMELYFIRGDSPSYQVLKDLGGQEKQVDVAPFIDLPSTWEAYLATLDRHNRHEIKRKIRRLEEEEVIKTSFSGDEKEIAEFFRLMALSNEQKRDFLSPDMKNFFEDVIKTFAESGELEMCFLKKEEIYIAAVIVFHYNNEVLLYNSGFDPADSYLSPGLILKAYMIRTAIEEKKARFDFLRGGERYKYNLGAKERKLYRFRF